MTDRTDAAISADWNTLRHVDYSVLGCSNTNDRR